MGWYLISLALDSDVALNGCNLTLVKIQALWCLNNLAVALATCEWPMRKRFDNCKDSVV